MDMGGWGEGEGEANGESSVEAYTPPYIRQIDNGNLLCELRELRPGLCNHREGWGKGREVGGDSRGKRHMYTYG